MVYTAVGNSGFRLVRSPDGFETVVDKEETLEKLLKQLEYDPNKEPFAIRIVTADEEKYEIEPAQAADEAKENGKKKTVKFCDMNIE